MNTMAADPYPSMPASVRWFPRAAVAAVLAGLALLSTSPAASQSHFRRGDCNQDAAIDISDPVGLLGHLFLGDDAPPCEDACDGNDDGVLDLSDAMYVLGFLFVDGPAPPPPYRSWDGDPTPDGLGCKEAIETVTGGIAGDVTWSADRTYRIEGAVRAFPGAILRIEAGTTIIAATTESVMVVQAGARLVARGSAERPIVFTSPLPPGARGPGDWGGLFLLGRTPTRYPFGLDRPVYPCFPLSLDDGDPFGGDDRGDDSGVLEFVRIEFAGSQLCPSNRSPALALWGVGAGTTIRHVQIRSSAGVSVYVAGGTVDFKNLLLSQNTGDGDLDVEHGWQGRGQFIVVQRTQQPSEASGARDSTTGVEAESSDDDFDALPRTLPVISNATIAGDGARRPFEGGLVRRGAGYVLRNSFVGGFERGIRLQGCASLCLPAPELDIRGNVFFDNVEAFRIEGDESCSGCLTVEALTAANRITADVVLMAPYEREDPDFRPAIETSPDYADLDPEFFEAAPYSGAVPPPGRGEDWTQRVWVGDTGE